MMNFRTVLVGLFGSLALAGCVETAEFGGSGNSFGGSGGFDGAGGSGSSSLSLARDVCTRTLRDQGRILVSIDSVREYDANNPRGVEVRMTTRRDAMTVSTEPRVCRFSYSSGTADISRT
jgi:hypothetical protein